jgi:hypothetical protein
MMDLLGLVFATFDFFDYYSFFSPLDSMSIWVG